MSYFSEIDIVEDALNEQDSSLPEDNVIFDKDKFIESGRYEVLNEGICEKFEKYMTSGSPEDMEAIEVHLEALTNGIEILSTPLVDHISKYIEKSVIYNIGELTTGLKDSIASGKYSRENFMEAKRLVEDFYVDTYPLFMNRMLDLMSDKNASNNSADIRDYLNYVSTFLAYNNEEPIKPNIGGSREVYNEIVANNKDILTAKSLGIIADYFETSAGLVEQSQFFKNNMDLLGVFGLSETELDSESFRNAKRIFQKVLTGYSSYHNLVEKGTIDQVLPIAYNKSSSIEFIRAYYPHLLQGIVDLSRSSWKEVILNATYSVYRDSTPTYRAVGYQTANSLFLRDLVGLCQASEINPEFPEYLVGTLGIANIHRLPKELLEEQWNQKGSSKPYVLQIVPRSESDAALDTPLQYYNSLKELIPHGYNYRMIEAKNGFDLVKKVAAANKEKPDAVLSGCIISCHSSDLGSLGFSRYLGGQLKIADLMTKYPIKVQNSFNILSRKSRPSAPLLIDACKVGNSDTPKAISTLIPEATIVSSKDVVGYNDSADYIKYNFDDENILTSITSHFGYKSGSENKEVRYLGGKKQELNIS